MRYQIHPAIGIARVGNSDEYYLAPEGAGELPINPDGRPFTAADFRDATRRIRRQGARFEIHAYEDDGAAGGAGAPVRPGEGGVQRIEWTVHLANKKAIWYQFIVNSGEAGYPPDHPLRNPSVTDSGRRRARIIDPGPRTLEGPNQAAEFSRDGSPPDYPASWPPPALRPFTIDTLGGMLTDAQGRMTVLGGHGRSGTTQATPGIVDYANNDDWWDDTSDGPVTARIVFEDGSSAEVEGSAWVLVGPTKYAPELVNLITLYDTIFDTTVRNMGYRPDIYHDSLWNTEYRPSWEHDIQPILERVGRYPWVVAIPPHAHYLDLEKLGNPDAEYNGYRGFYLQLIRSPSDVNLFTTAASGLPMMPFLCGDNCFEPGPLTSNYAALTSTQYFFLQQWAQGKFTVGEERVLARGQALDRGALENCVGGAFSPGIEVTWLSRNPLLYEAPFRIHRKRDVPTPLSLGEDLALGLEPGDLSKRMAIPWQADFNECSAEQVGDRYLYWWPVQRPSFVFTRRGKRLKQVAWAGSLKDQTASNYLEFADDLDMVKLWNRLGFVFNEGTPEEPEFVEVERVLRRERAVK